MSWPTASGSSTTATSSPRERPAQLKAEIGSPTVEVTPTEPESGDRLAELLSGFGEMRRNGNGSVTVQLPGGEAELAEIVRILDRADLHVQTLQLHQPSLDDVFLAKTGRKLEGSADGAQRPRRRRMPAAVAGGGAVAVDAAAAAASPCHP